MAARRRHTQDLIGAAQTLPYQTGATPAALTALAVTTAGQLYRRAHRH
ncbi:MAG: hypothetical protein R2854_19630 [Caldilineaceae bacterium]